MNDMIERVARAMQESKAWPAVFDAGTAQELARAAIKAMREPTPAMLAWVVVRTHYGELRDYELAHEAVRLLFVSANPDVADVLAELARDHRAMIDAALSQPNEGDGE